MALPVEPGVYADRIGDLWELRQDGRWQYLARGLPFGGLSGNVDSRPVTADALESFHDPELEPLRRVVPDSLAQIDDENQ